MPTAVPATAATTGFDMPTSACRNLNAALSGPRGFEPMSVKGPALIVLGLAVFILIGGVVASALDSSSGPTVGLKPAP